MAAISESIEPKNKPSEKPVEKIPFFMGEPFERMIGIIIAVVTLLAAIVALLEADAAAATSKAARQAQQYAIQAIGVKAAGEIETGFAWTDAYQQYLAWDTAANIATSEGDDAALARYEAVRDRVSGLSPLLDAPYFDPESGEIPNIKAFEANLYLVETTILSERFLAAIDQSGDLEDKEKAYGSQLLLLAVSLFLYGLSITIVGKMKWLFVGIGTLIVNISLVWMLMVYVQPVSAFPDDAIVAYAEGVGLAHQGDLNGATAAFDQAIKTVPDYANALYARGNVHYRNNDYQSAVADYEGAIEAGREDVNVPWNLGWNYYLLGQQDEAIESAEAALELVPDQVALHFNLALAQLAKGEIDEARQRYNLGIALASQQVYAVRDAGEQPPASMWWYLSTAASDIDHLVTCVNESVCTEAPPIETLDHLADEANQDLLAGLRLDLKSTAVALEYLDEPPELATAEITAVDFATAVYDEAGLVVDYAPLGAEGENLRFGTVQESEGIEVDDTLVWANPDDNEPVYIKFDFDRIVLGQLFTMKVYRDGRESPGLRLVENWELGTAGEAVLPLTPSDQLALASGDYRVELYVDATLVQESTFSIE